MVIARERPQAVQNLVKKILGTQLLQNFAIDLGPYFNIALPVDKLYRFGDQVRDSP